MRDAKNYKIMHVKNEAHADLMRLKKKTGKPMTEIVAALARAAIEGYEESACAHSKV